MQYRSLFLLFLPVLFQTLLEAETQPRPPYLDQPGEVRVVGEVLSGQSYPLVVFLPYTTGSGARFYDGTASQIPLESYVALIPRGTTQRTDYLPDFIAYVDWYEERIMADIAALKREGLVDERRIYLAGFSLGGDLAWAFMMKKPDIFRGALIMGSRCSYPGSAQTFNKIKELNRRLVFQIHQGDDQARVRGMASAASRTKIAGILHRHIISPDGGHGLPAPAEIREAWEFLFARG